MPPVPYVPASQAAEGEKKEIERVREKNRPTGSQATEGRKRDGNKMEREESR